MLINETMTPEDVYSKVSKLSDSTKYQLLNNHQKPRNFPKSFQDGCNRSFRYEYYTDRPWLVYSTHLDGALCSPCVLFADYPARLSLQALVNSPFKRWFRVTNAIKSHDSKPYHIDAVVKAKSFVNTIENPAFKVSNMLDSKKLANISNNRALLSHIIRAILYLSQQGQPLRGHDETKESKNRGNFIELLYLLAQYSPELEQHLQRHEKKTNVTYISPKSQNELLQLIGVECIRSNLVKDIQEAKFYSILCPFCVTKLQTPEKSLCH